MSFRFRKTPKSMLFTENNLMIYFNKAFHIQWNFWIICYMYLIILHNLYLTFSTGFVDKVYLTICNILIQMKNCFHLNFNGCKEKQIHVQTTDLF